MQQQEAQAQAAPASHEIEAAPPAYAPRSAEGPQDADHSLNQPPAPVKDMPTDLNTAQKSPPMAPGAPQPPVLGVTPLDQLGQQPQWIDCPFCQRRTMTRVNKDGTPMQIVAGVLCCLLCVCLACVPCMAGWFEETHYFCSQCNNKVAMRPESGPVVVFTPATVVPSKHVHA